MDTKHIYSVSELNSEVSSLLQSSLGLIWLEAEISNLARPASGHWYFTLKDSQSQIRCACFKNRNRLVNFKPEDGQQVLVRGKLGLYEARGDYQLIVENIQLAGEGELQRQFDLIKQKLQAEGLFDAEQKRELPAYPKRIGLITSPTGAAIHDLLNVHARRYPQSEIIIYPTAVQGEAAPKQIMQMLAIANKRQECDALVLARGGGSLEDLWAFNNESLARAVYDSKLPIVTGVGHETDFTIVDFVSDYRAPTPSAAMEVITPDQHDLSQEFDRLLNKLSHVMQNNLREYAQQVDWYDQRLVQKHPDRQLKDLNKQIEKTHSRLHNAVSQRLNQHNKELTHLHKRLNLKSPKQHIVSHHQYLAQLHKRLRHLTKHSLDHAVQRLSDTSHRLDIASPLATLGRGYSITIDKTTKNIVSSVNQTEPNHLLETRLSDGKIISRVEQIHEDS